MPVNKSHYPEYVLSSAMPLCADDLHGPVTFTTFDLHYHLPCVPAESLYLRMTTIKTCHYNFCRGMNLSEGSDARSILISTNSVTASAEGAFP